MNIKFGQMVRYIPNPEYPDTDQFPPSDCLGVVVGMGSNVCEDCDEIHTWVTVMYENDTTPWGINVGDLEVDA